MKTIDRDLAYCLTAAVRYQIGRRTYGSAIVAPTVRRHLPLMEMESLRVLERDLDEAFRDKATGDACDTREWTELRLHVTREITERLSRRISA